MADYFKDMTTEQLQEEARNLNQLINGMTCYGVRDIVYLDSILVELDKRGVVASESLIFNEKQ